LNPNIFREYDIRGNADNDLTDDAVHKIGKAFAAHALNCGKKNVVLGRDCRLSSPRLHATMQDAMLSSGLNVVDVGICPTPVFYYSLFHLEREGGIHITGSHNPELKKIAENGDFVDGKGSLSSYEIIPAYQKEIIENITLERPLRVVVDAGNGTAGPVAPAIIRELGCEVEELYCDMDGNFPNHHPDPTVPKYLTDLIGRIKSGKFDCGLAYDGDADRIGAIDENGEILWGDQLLMLFAREILERKPGSVVISEVKSSKTLYDDVAAHGGKPIMWKTGHSLIKGKMKETKAAVAGEMSGHIFFDDRYYGFDDAIYSSCRLLEILSRTDKPLSQLLADVPQMHSTPEIRMECPDDVKFKAVEELTRYFKDNAYDVVDVDGARVTFEDGWGLVRASNTQPVLVLRFEATSEKRRDEIRELIEGQLKKVLE
jgi:phosphomannomutase/phosphoglucomutase